MPRPENCPCHLPHWLLARERPATNGDLEANILMRVVHNGRTPYIEIREVRHD